ncbi:MAG: circadian clock protein KaiC [Gammaproteobacteria bacterium]|nr:circadian clock protein KaiC [Gammaproteobacteria bacterium]
MDKLSTGVTGLDKILNGGYLKNKPTLLKGGPGCGKTVFCLFFAHSNILAGRHVTYLTCDESPESILNNMEQYGMSAVKAVENNQLNILDFRPDLSNNVLGSFELDALFLRIQSSLSAVDPVLIIDSLQNLLMGLEIKNLTLALLNIFSWCRARGITLLAASANMLSNEDGICFEEYAADCVIVLTQVMNDNMMTRFLRVVKMRNAAHLTNEYPFILNKKGALIFPVVEESQNGFKIRAHLSTGNQQLNEMLGGAGYIEGSILMISGSPGTGKSLLAAMLAVSAVAQAKKVLYLTFEESPGNFIANTKEAGIHLHPLIESKMLTIRSLGLEQHLIIIASMIDELKPAMLIIDPITAFLDIVSAFDLRGLLIRMISYLKSKNITLVFTDCSYEATLYAQKDIVMLASLADTWINMNLVQSNAAYHRTIRVVKARGIASQGEVRKFEITDQGLQIENNIAGK